jgi:Mce-associated membrane protein
VARERPDLGWLDVSTDGEKPDAAEAPRLTSSPAARARRIGGASHPATGRRPSPGPSASASAAPAAPEATAPAPHRPSPVPGPSTVRRPRTTPLQRLAILVAGLLVIALAAADVLLWQPWHHEQTAAEQRERLIASVNPAVAKVVSYDYRHIDQDTAAAAAYLAEPFRDEYQRSIKTTIRAQALKLKSVVQGEVGSSGITSVTDDGKQATVLVLGQQTITNTLHPATNPERDPISVRVTLTLVHGRWLISKMDLV